jgi:4-carboxymuconolactone decarboxylase
MAVSRIIERPSLRTVLKALASRAMPSTPRIPPLAPEEMDDQARELVGEVGGETRGAVNIFLTLVRHPGLFRRWLPFGGKLLVGKLPARDRELMILRTGWNCDAEYEWAQHVVIARRSGLGDDEIARIKEGPDAAGWDPFDATLLRAADELHRDSVLSDATWAALAERYDERQLIEVPMLVGHYHMVAYALNSLGVQVEPDVAAESQ